MLFMSQHPGSRPYLFKMGYFNTKETRLVIALISATLIGIATSYPNSVPNSPDVCSKMTPGHGPRPQQDPSPYEIILNKQKMQGGNNLQIVIQGKNNQKFKGFYIQARDQDNTPIGTFLIPDENMAGVHSCFNSKNNAAHHKNREDKDSITVYWKAPESFDGQVRVLATVLKDFETYWTNVKAPELVSVSQTSNSIFPSSTFPEKRKTESAENSKATRILNYNPYSPFSPLALSSWGENLNHSDNLSSPSAEEHMLTQASEDSSVTEPRERQLFGIPNFDFHGGSLFSPPKASSPPRKPKNVHFSSGHHGHHDYNQLPYTEPLDDDYYHSSLYGHSHNERPPLKTIFKSPKASHNKFGLRQPYKEKHSESEYLRSPQKPVLPFSYPPLESPTPYHFHLPPQTIHESSATPFFPSNTYPSPLKPLYTPHIAQSIESDRGGHYLINHHYLHKPGNFHKPATDPSYPNSGYFPKDILTKITSYLPNIYNALTNNPLFNFNIDNTVESIWKPMKGHIPNKHQYDHYGSSVPGLSTSASTTKAEMPKYGYLVYNPVRKNPYFVIPAENDDEFVANHMGRTGRRRKDRKDTTPMYIPKSV